MGSEPNLVRLVLTCRYTLLYISYFVCCTYYTQIDYYYSTKKVRVMLPGVPLNYYMALNKEQLVDVFLNTGVY